MNENFYEDKNYENYSELNISLQNNQKIFYENNIYGELDENSDVIFLSAGTDGTDGPTNDAGGLVDRTTIELGNSLHLDYAEFLKKADSGNYLEKVKALVTTGPTGTNVMDLVLAIKL
jgi:hydroxypyruvate reductase